MNENLSSGSHAKQQLAVITAESTGPVESAMHRMLTRVFQGHNVRVVVIDGEPWFVGKDVAEVLGYADTAKAIKAHCKSYRPVGVGDSPTPLGLDPQTIIIPERDLYRLVMRSKLPAAEQFEEWVVSNVLPDIRKTGQHVDRAPSDPMALLRDPHALRAMLLGYSEENIQLKTAVAELAPKAEALDRIEHSDGSFCLTDAAKVLQVQPRKLTARLQQMGWIYRRPMGSGWLAYQDRLALGLMEHKVTTGEKTDGTEWVSTQVRITAKGIARLAVVVSKDDGAF